MMDKKIEDLYRLRKNHLNSAAELFSKVFFEDNLAKLMFPEEETREQNLYHYFQFRINYGLLYGEVYATSSNLEGLAVWVYSENIEMTNWRNMRAGGFKLYCKVGRDAIVRMSKIGTFTSTLHKKHASFPHIYLAPIGVDPKFQGKGYASKLLRPMLNRLDQDKVYCFLETQSETNVDIYLHYGFQVLSKTTIPDTKIGHWLMERSPE